MKAWKILKKTLLTLGFLVIISVFLFCIIHYKSELPPDRLVEKYAYPESKFLKWNDLNVHYRKTGEGPVLMLIHGFGANLRNWASWHQILSDSFTVISLDLPGYGITGPRSDGLHKNSDQVSFLNSFIEELGIDSFAMAGNSMGGGIAWLYASAHPEKLTKLVLLNSAGYPDLSDDSKENVLAFRILKMPVINTLVTRITPSFVLQQSIEEIYADPRFATKESLASYMDITRRKGNRAVLVERMTTPWEDMRSKITSVTTPTLIMWGDQDHVIDVQFADHFHRDIQGSELIIYENIGHVPMVEHAQQSALDVRRFLTDKM